MAYTSVSAFTLLARDDSTGKLLIDTRRFDVGLAGAALSDLSLAGRIQLSDRKIVVADRSPVASPAVDQVLASIAAEPKPRSTGWWIARLATKELRLAVLADLVADGTLTRTTVQVLRLFSSERFPTVDPEREAEIRGAVASVLAEKRAPDPASSTVIMLCNATGLLRTQFGKHPSRLVKSIVDGTWSESADGAVRSQVQKSVQAQLQQEMSAAIAGSVATSVAVTVAAGS